MQAGDILTENEAAYIEALEDLWVMVSDMVEGGRLREADIPDDYRALVRRQMTLSSLRAAVDLDNDGS